MSNNYFNQWQCCFLLTEDESWNEREAAKRRLNDRDDISEVSASAAAARGANDGKSPLLEFAMSYFREREKFEAMQQAGNDDPKEAKKKDKKKKGKKNSNVSQQGDWTWKDQVDIVKWTDRMISVSCRCNQLIQLIC